MTDKQISLAPGQRVIVRGPDAPGKYVSVPSVTLQAGDTATVSVQASTPPPEPPPPEPPPAPNPSGIAVPPVKDGWKRIMFDDFTTNIPLGEWGKVGGTFEFPGKERNDGLGYWRARTAGWPDSSHHGTYNSPKTTTQEGSKLRVYLHTENGVHYVAAPIPVLPGYNDSVSNARIGMAIRADAVEGYKMAPLLWPNSGSGNQYGEIDIPEGTLKGGTLHGFMHFDPEPSSGTKQYGWNSGKGFQTWHKAELEWHGRASCQFFVDDVASPKYVNNVPRAPMHYVMQFETALGGAPEPPDSAAGYIEVDWFYIDVPA